MNGSDRVLANGPSLLPSGAFRCPTLPVVASEGFGFSDRLNEVAFEHSATSLAALATQGCRIMKVLSLQ